MVTDEIRTPGGDLLAIVIRGRSRPARGHDFVTPAAEPLQVGLLTMSRGEALQPHVHREQPRPACASQECLIVRRGRIRLDLYDGFTLLTQRWLEQGDLVVLLGGGHGLEACEDASELIEVKLGPYAGAEADKVRFVPTERAG